MCITEYGYFSKLYFEIVQIIMILKNLKVPWLQFIILETNIYLTGFKLRFYVLVILVYMVNKHTIQMHTIHYN